MIAAEPNLLEPIRRAAGAAKPPQFGVITEAAVVALMFPIVKYLLNHVGLPWLAELKRYSEPQRRKLHEWIDGQYRREGFDPDAAEAASDALCDEMEGIVDETARAAWQQLAARITEP